MREKKSINFSTRWTASMDDSINNLSEVMLITKQDLVRIALSEYIRKQDNIIKEYRDYRKNEGDYIYDSYHLGTTNIGGINENDVIFGVIKVEESGEYEAVDELVAIDIRIPLKTDVNEIDYIFKKLKESNEEEEMELRRKLNKLMIPWYKKEITLKYTAEGIMVEDDPKFKVYLEKSIKELVDKYNGEEV